MRGEKEIAECGGKGLKKWHNKTQFFLYAGNCYNIQTGYKNKQFIKLKDLQHLKHFKKESFKTTHC